MVAGNLDLVGNFGKTDLSSYVKKALRALAIGRGPYQRQKTVKRIFVFADKYILRYALAYFQ